jgi:hypothetical protein
MKKLTILSAMLILLASCGSKSNNLEEVIASGDLEQLRAVKEQLSVERDSLSSSIAKIERAISEVDTVQKLALVSTVNIQDTLFKHYVGYFRK